MKRWIAMLLIAGAAGLAFAQSPAASSDRYTAALVLDASSGRILFEKNAHTPLPTASMAKMMTLLIAMEEIKAGSLTLDTMCTVSARASKMGGSQVFLKDGQQWPVKDMFAATMVHSANDAATTLAERIGGSNEAFAEMMNQRGKAMGLENSTFYDPHGLPADSVGEENMMTAADLAKVGMEVMKYPLMRQLAMQQQMPFLNATFTTMYNPNRLLKIYPYATGIKTGYSGKSGFCVTASASKNNMDLVAVVMGAKTARGPDSSFEIAAGLFNDAFNSYRMVEVVKQGASVGQAAVTKGAEKGVTALAGEPARVLVRRGEEKSLRSSFNGSVVAPVKKGQQIGTIMVTQGTQVVAKVPALAAADVGPAPWWQKFWPF